MTEAFRSQAKLFVSMAAQALRRRRPGYALPGSYVAGGLLALVLFSGAFAKHQVSGAFAKHQGDPSNSGITTPSPLMDAIIQNTPGHSEGYPVGVPRTYAWCSGSSKSKNHGPPPDFTAVVGWGQVYPEFGATPPDPDQTATIEIANAKTFVRLKESREWLLVQDQATMSLAGAYFVSDFSPDRVSIPMETESRPDGSIAINSPPAGHNAHFWIVTRGVYPAGSADDVYVEMDMRISDAHTKHVANVGADWWRDAAAPFVEGFANNPGVGMSNWISLSPEWSKLRFYSSSTEAILAAPPPPLEDVARNAAAPTVTRRRAVTLAPCLSRAYQPLPNVPGLNQN
jgi:hypothetical protein